MKKNITIVLLMLAITFTYGQGIKGTANINDGFRTNAKHNKGHQFLLDNWVVGFLVDNNGKLSERKLLNYDIYNNNPTFKASNDSKDILVIDKSLYSGFVLTDSKNNRYIFTKIEGSKFNKKKKENKYYQLINAPKKNIILESVKKMKDPNASGWTSSRDNTLGVSFVLRTTYYVLNNNNKYIKIKSITESSILKALKEKKKELKSYIKERNLKIKNPEDLIPVLDYYYGLK